MPKQTREEWIEESAEKLHQWYLEITGTLKPESFNPDAQKSYQDLTEEQRKIDRYIAAKAIDHTLDRVEGVIGKNYNKNLCDEERDFDFAEGFDYAKDEIRLAIKKLLDE